jgi:DNA-directed RNA polymerase subunit RPC12/RpoP
MELSHKTVCGELLLDIIFYEKFCGRLSAEMDYLLEQHLNKCAYCRSRILGFEQTLLEPAPMRNFG